MNDAEFRAKLQALDGIRRSIEFIGLGPTQYFIEDEHKQDRLEKLEKDFITIFSDLEKACRGFPANYKNLVETYRPFYSNIIEKIEIRGPILSELNRLKNKIKAAIAKISGFPQPKALAVVKEMNVDLYNEVMNFEKKFLIPLTEKINDFIEKYANVLRPSDIDFLKKSSGMFTNYIAAYE